MLDLEPFAPVSFSQVPRKISRVEQLKNQVRAVLRRTMRVAEVAVRGRGVRQSSGISWARTRYHPPPRPSPGTALTAPELRLETATTSPGRIADTSTVRRMVLGEGPDAIPLIAWGRVPGLEGRTVRFPSTADDLGVGRLNLDLVDRDGISAVLMADVTTSAPPSSFWSGIREQLLGVTREPQAALALLGSPGRYVAVVVSGTGEPVAFEWALGERRGTMLGPPSPSGGRRPREAPGGPGGSAAGLRRYRSGPAPGRRAALPGHRLAQQPRRAPHTRRSAASMASARSVRWATRSAASRPTSPSPWSSPIPSPAKSKTVAKGTVKRKTPADKKPVSLRPPAPTTRHAKK